MDPIESHIVIKNHISFCTDSVTDFTYLHDFIASEN